jgi:hypothetical protein
MLNKLRLRLRKWLFWDHTRSTSTENGKTVYHSQVRPADILGDAMDLIMSHQRWLTVLDERVHEDSERTDRLEQNVRDGLVRDILAAQPKEESQP